MSIATGKPQHTDTMRNTRNIRHIIYIPFTGVGLHGGMRSPEWFSKRIQVFKDHTLKSLVNQKNKDFTLWCSFRAEEFTNPLTRQISNAIREAGISYRFTFDGLMYWDDKFTHFTPRVAFRNFLMMLWDCWKYKQLKNPLEVLRHSFQNKNSTLESRIASSLLCLPGRDSKWIYLTRIDSDDMFHKDAVKIIQAAKPAKKKALVFTNGFVLNKQTGQLADWNPKTNPPFHTIIFPSGDFFDAKKHLAYYGDYRSHESIPHVFKAEKLPDEKYCYVVNHGNISTYWNTQMYLVTTETGTNIGTRWNTSWLGKLWLKYKNPTVKITQEKHPFIGREYSGKVKKEILKNFGL